MADAEYVYAREVSIGVILLNWNGFDDTAAALGSLWETSPRPSYVIVVDNGSHDRSLPRLREWADATGIDAVSYGLHSTPPATITPEAHPWLVFIDAERNLGFAAGNNVGLDHLARHTQATHFLLLNNDTLVANDYFARLQDAVRNAGAPALLGSAIYHEPDRDRVWYAGGREIPYRALVLHRYDVPNDDRLQPTTFVTGCAMLIAREIYEELGGLAECYTPIYWEDTDYSRRAVDTGHFVAWAPAARVYHKVGSSVGGERITPQVAYWQNRHRGYYVRRNYRGLDRWMALTYLYATKPARSIVELLRGRPAMARAIARGFAHGVWGVIP